MDEFLKYFEHLIHIQISFFHFRNIRTMASKEPAKSKSKFPRRILSSLRKNKKSSLTSLSYKNDFRDTSICAGDFDTSRNETSLINMEASLPLDSPMKSSEEGAVQNIMPPIVEPEPQSYRPINSDVSILENISRELDSRDYLSPNSRRVELGGSMSSSTDSGIDCSLLMSEKSSPEQFVAFTRREAERLRQEQQIAGFNESILATLNEVDSRSSSDIENDLRNSTLNGSSLSNALNATVTQNTGDLLDATIVSVSSQENDLLTDYSGESVNTANMVSVVENGDYVTLSGQSEVNSHSATEQSDYVTLISSSSARVGNHFEGTQVNSTAKSCQMTNTVSSSQEREQFVNGDYVNYCANKTDDSKSVEAGIPSPSCHDIVNPTPVISSGIATQRTLSSTPSPANLYINENSAFAKCKSIKRSVSGVGKGFFGRFRHKSKDSVSSHNDSVCEESKLEKSGKGSANSVKKVKKTKTKGDKYKSKEKRQRTDNLDISLTVNPKRTKSPVLKEIVPSFTLDRSNMSSHGRKSPVMKEILCEQDRRQITSEISRHESPARVVSLQDFTDNMSRMTSALHASSAESIACICDCKNRNTNPDCCEKRKTPSPHLLNGLSSVSPSNIINESMCPNKTLELYSELDSFDNPDSLSKSISEFNPAVCRSDENKTHQHSFCDDCESADESQSDSDDGEAMGDNLDCSKLCVASPHTGKYSLSDDESSDTETCSLNSFLSNSSSGSSQTSNASQSFHLDVNASAHSLHALIDSEAQHSLVPRDRKVVLGSKQSAHSFSSSSSSSSRVSTPDRFSENDLGSCGYNKRLSSNSASFHEVDFDSGEVMYVDNSMCEDFDGMMDSPSPAPLPNFTQKSLLQRVPDGPVPSPCASNRKNNIDSPFKYPINKSWGTISAKDSGSRVSSKSNKQYNAFDNAQDSSFTNISFEGSFAESSFSVKTHSVNSQRKPSNMNQSVDLGYLGSHSFLQERVRSRERVSANVNRHSAPVDKLSMSFSHPTDLYRPAHQSVNASFSGSVADFSFGRDTNNFQRNMMRRSLSAAHSQNHDQSFSRNSRQYSSFHESSPCPSPLDLSMNKGSKERMKDGLKNKSTKWLDNHVGQVMSPARRVLQKNRGVSESDLCKEILNLYVSDVDESCLDESVADCDMSLNASNSSQLESSYRVDGMENQANDSVLSYGTYVAPRHVVRETNVDDFKTTTVWTCYSGEARTRRLQGWFGYEQIYYISLGDGI